MLKKKFLISVVILIWFIFFCDLMANLYFLYWRFWWTDIIMHFMGGFWVALSGYYLLYFSDFKEKFKKITQRYSVFMISLGFVFGVGISWELFEFFLGVSLKGGYILDTILDLIMDMLGWLGAYIFILRKMKNLQVAEMEGTDRIE